VDEILPIEAFKVDPKTNTRVRVIVDKDDGIRHGTTIEGLRKIRAAFKEFPPSHSTGGNSSQITDGAAAVVMMRRSKARELGLKVLARYVVAVATGHEPRLSECACYVRERSWNLLANRTCCLKTVPIGPTYAIPRVLELTGLKVSDVDLFEVNEGVVFSLVSYPEKSQSLKLWCQFESICRDDGVHDQQARPRPRKGQRERRCNRLGPSVWLHWCAADRDCFVRDEAPWWSHPGDVDVYRTRVRSSSCLVSSGFLYSHRLSLIFQDGCCICDRQRAVKSQYTSH
jgi:hypothetical protein